MNVIIFRSHEGGSVVNGRSKCRQCKEIIKAKDLIPVWSYLWLKGRCRNCQSSISWQYPVVEMTTGVLFFLVALNYLLDGDQLLGTGLWTVIRDWVFVSFLIIIFVYDLRHMLILDVFTLPAMIFAFIVHILIGSLSIETMLIGGGILGFFFWIQFFVSKGQWVGGGDIRMGALMGIMLGIQQGLFALFLAYLLGAIVGVFLLSTGKANRKTPIPFGTFLSIAAVVSILVGQPMVDWYLGLFL